LGKHERNAKKQNWTAVQANYIPNMRAPEIFAKSAHSINPLAQ
jgi:hypothetical protein